MGGGRSSIPGPDNIVLRIPPPEEAAVRISPFVGCVQLLISRGR